MRSMKLGYACGVRLCGFSHRAYGSVHNQTTNKKNASDMVLVQSNTHLPYNLFRTLTQILFSAFNTLRRWIRQEGRRGFYNYDLISEFCVGLLRFHCFRKVVEKLIMLNETIEWEKRNGVRVVIFIIYVIRYIIYIRLSVCTIMTYLRTSGLIYIGLSLQRNLGVEDLIKGTLGMAIWKLP